MERVRYLIIGGGAAGTTAAETIRTQDSKGSVLIVSDEPNRFYSRVLLSKPEVFLEKISLDRIWLKNEAWYRDQRITLLTATKAVRLEPLRKVVMLQNNKEIAYEKLLLAIGGKPRTWSVPGAEKQGVFSLRTLDDAKAVTLEIKKTKRALVVGGGFIGFELCQALRLAGIDVSLLLRGSYPWERTLDEASGKIILEALEGGGVSVFPCVEAVSVEGKERIEGVVLNDGSRISCDMAVVGIGVVFPIDWLKGSGVAVDGGIIVDERLETSVSGIYAAGDIAEFSDAISGERVQFGNWANAQAQGRTAGLNMAGARDSFRLVSSYTTRGFGLTIAFVGNVRMSQDREVICRESPKLRSCARLILKENRVVGATLLNRIGELGIIAKLIERGTNVSQNHVELADPDVPLQRFLE